MCVCAVAHNLGSETKKATGIPMYMAIGQCGSVLGSHIFPATDGPRYIKGFAGTPVCMVSLLPELIVVSSGMCPRIFGGDLRNCTDGKLDSMSRLSRTLIYRAIPQIYYRLENRRRDRKYGVPERDAAVDTTELADEVRVVPAVLCTEH